MRRPQLPARLRRRDPSGAAAVAEQDRARSAPGRPSERQAEGCRHLAYRPAIDGLRAIAVLAVIVSHIDEQLLPGGWLGVDVFFVISGFLITTLLLRERARTGRIDLVSFWLARGRRLLPALLVVLAAILVAARTIGLPARLQAVSADVISTFFYVANWRMIFSDEAYFAGLAIPSPLRHAWSLGVEEQYYILYPLLLLLLLRLTPKRLHLAGALGLLAVLSATLMAVLHTPGTEPTRVYYGTDTRVFELLIGAVVAVLVLRGTGQRPAPVAARVDHWSRVVAPLALLLVPLTFLLAQDAVDVLFRGGLVVFCLLCASLVLAAASWEPNLVQRVLSWEPLRRVGLISYGLYLWHWPIIVYLNQLMVEASPVVRGYLQVVLSFVAATLSYLLVERPIRRHGLKVLLPRAPRIAMGVGAVASAAVLVGAWVLPAGSDPAAGAGEVTNNLSYEAPPYVSGEVQRRALLVGNSIPESYARYYPQQAYPDLLVSEHTHVGCDIFPDRRFHGEKLEPADPGCETWRDGWDESIRSVDPDVVVVFVSQSLVTDRQVDGRRLSFDSEAYPRYVADRLDDLRARIRSAGDRQLALVNLACHRVPDFGNDQEVTRLVDDIAVQRVNTVVGDWAEENDVPVVDQYSFLCGDGYHDGINDVPLYEDYLHLSRESGPEVWSWMAPQVRDIANGESPQP